MRKIWLAKRVMGGDTDCLSGSVKLALCYKVDSLIYRVRGCRVLEKCLGTHFTETIICNACILREMKNVIMGVDKEKVHWKAPMTSKVAELSG